MNFETFNSHLANFNRKFLNIMSINIRSISSINKFNEFKLLISQFEILPNIIAVQETWFQDNLKQIYNIPGYIAVHCCRNDAHGGTSIFIRDNFECTVEYCESKHFFDAIIILLNDFKIEGKPLKITSFYRSQKCNLETFYRCFEDILQDIGISPSVIMGDSNIDFLNSSLSSDLSNLLHDFDYKSCHSLITRPYSGKSIDNIFSNFQNAIVVDSVECKLSDHNLISCKIISSAERNEISNRKYRQCDYSLLRQSVLNEFGNMRLCGDATADMTRLLRTFSECVQNSSIEKEGIGFSGNLITPWVNENLLSLIRWKKKLLLKRRKKSKDLGIESRIKSISKVIKKAIKICMNSFYQTKLREFQANPKKCWKFLNEHLGRARSSEIRLKNDNGDYVTNNEMCEMFNDFFVNIPKVLKSKIRYFPGDNFNMFDTLTPVRYSFHFCATYEEEVLEFVSKLQINKSPGHDDVNTKMLKVCEDVVLPKLIAVFNTIINTSVYPDILKISKIVPIPKGKGLCSIDSFRPIALLSLFDKLLEKVLHRQLTAYFEDNNLLYRFQFGFKKGSGTQEAIVNVVNTICEGLDNGYGGVAGVFYDLSKAFDLVDHEILLRKLRFYGIVGNAHKLIESYLRNRKQFVQIDGCSSRMEDIQYGVPQGSVLGPLLFTVYLNDIANMKLHGKLIMYADDMSLFYPYCHEVILKAQIEHDANAIHDFARINGLVLNSEKTRIVRFRPHASGSNDFNVSICGRNVIENTCLKYLGIHFQSNLSWNSHMQYLKSKVTPAIGLLYKFKNKFDKDTKLLLYNALIHSHYNYLPMIYAGKKNADFKSLQRSQNKALRIVYNLPQRYCTELLFKNISKTTLPICGLYKMQLLTYMYKSLNNIGYHVITFNQNQTRFNTRNSDNLHVKRCRLETTRQRIEHSGCSEYNHLPQSIKNIPRISSFKSNLKLYLMDNMEMLLM